MTCLKGKALLKRDTNRFAIGPLVSECRATHASGLHCTLAPGHAGDHIAQAIDVREVLRWQARAIVAAAVTIEPSDEDAAADTDETEAGGGGGRGSSGVSLHAGGRRRRISSGTGPLGVNETDELP